MLVGGPRARPGKWRRLADVPCWIKQRGWLWLILAPGLREPCIGKAGQSNAIAERSQVVKRGGIVEVVECCVESWSQDKWIEYLAKTADSFRGLSAFIGTAKDVQSAGQPKPRSPVLRKVHESGPERCHCLLGTVVILEIPAAAKPPIAGVTSRFGPRIKQITTPVRLPGIGQGSYQGSAVPT